MNLIGSGEPSGQGLRVQSLECDFQGVGFTGFRVWGLGFSLGVEAGLVLSKGSVVAFWSCG